MWCSQQGDFKRLIDLIDKVMRVCRGSLYDIISFFMSVFFFPCMLIGPLLIWWTIFIFISCEAVFIFSLDWAKKKKLMKILDYGLAKCQCGETQHQMSLHQSRRCNGNLPVEMNCRHLSWESSPLKSKGLRWWAPDWKPQGSFLTLGIVCDS